MPQSILGSYRELFHYRAQDLARALGISTSLLRAYSNGDRTEYLSGEQLMVIADKLFDLQEATQLLLARTHEHSGKTSGRPTKYSPRSRAYAQYCETVYAVKANGKIKVGFTNQLARRMTDYHLHNPDIDLLASVPATRGDERLLHHVLQPYRLEGEWFLDCPPVEEAIKEWMETHVA